MLFRMWEYASWAVRVWKRNERTNEPFVISVMAGNFLLKNLFNRQDLSHTPSRKQLSLHKHVSFQRVSFFPKEIASELAYSWLVQVLSCYFERQGAMYPITSRWRIATGLYTLTNTNAWYIVERMHRRPMQKIHLDYNRCILPAGECSLFKKDSWKPSYFRGGRSIM